MISSWLRKLYYNIIKSKKPQKKVAYYKKIEIKIIIKVVLLFLV